MEVCMSVRVFFFIIFYFATSTTATTIAAAAKVHQQCCHCYSLLFLNEWMHLSVKL